MAKTPEDSALAAVAKAITDEQKAAEKWAAADSKLKAATEALERAVKTTKWAAAHPDLPDDFDLETFRVEQLTPFEEEPTEENQDEEQPLAGDPDGLEPVTIPDDASEIVDDPFGDDEPAETPKARRR